MRRGTLEEVSGTSQGRQTAGGLTATICVKFLIGISLYFNFTYVGVYIYGCMYVWAPYMCMYQWSRKKVLDLGLELKTSVSCHVGSGNQTWFP